MNSPEKPKSPSRTTSPPPIIKPSMRPFKRRKSSFPPISPIRLTSSSSNTTPTDDFASLQHQLNHTTQQLATANTRARTAEQKEKRLRELAKRFWTTEWSGMREVMLLVSEEVYVREIEERVWEEYGELFGDVEEAERGRHGDGEMVEVEMKREEE